ncbi:molybdate ABC transporter substrate-binding protein [Aciduricibacillus chroicocephali]|uniref:Molybdate ABC transporter substrate-binding protein n=1 Tax=Aciduricibacillus chroicocephali TaxID=3054939 RepID=A0ABY9KX38_9BACI|nr:molybdate ABC transporter substrate-binding protein [Bacillaceae bacterium 44XB]
MKKSSLLVISLLLTVMLAACGTTNDSKKEDKSSNKNNSKPELTISAAVSLTDALEEMKKDFEKVHDVKVKFNLGSSGTLAQQIQQGAPADVFISANQDWMDKLELSGDIKKGTRSDVTGNRIVLITKKDGESKVKKIKDLTAKNAGQIAIGNPESVPAGAYTEDTLKHLKKWDKLKNHFIMAKDVRQVLTYTETGNADLGFVYASDAATSNKVKIIDTADKSWHEPIIYPGAVTTDSKYEIPAKEFLDYMKSSKGQEILKKYGFEK